MQEDLIKELKEKEIEIELWSEKILCVKDDDRAIAVALIEDFSEVDGINNLVMEKIYSAQNREKQTVMLCDKYPMQKILWDVYIVFVLTDKEKFVDKEQLFMLQRDKKYSKKYLVQGENVEEIAEKIVKLLYPNRYIDNVMKKIQYEVSDDDNCKKICDAENAGKRYVEQFHITCCQDILNFLDKVNADGYGEKMDENC